ncbi:MAG: sigma-70 family RNA polymerase sigma factor [bacterium]|nr:sigma-70 family RNA polymerase sigma factor [bacterium]
MEEPSTLDALLEQRDFLRALARRLVRDESRADDVVQDAWVAAMERPPGALGSPRAWIARVTRNLALNACRSEDRRGAREREVARPATAPSAADIAATLSVQRELANAIEALPEGMRAAIYLRFFEDLPPRDIASRLGVPVETARSRVRRGVERLRQELDDAHGGDRRSWCLALVPLTRTGRRFTRAFACAALITATAILAPARLGSTPSVLPVEPAARTEIESIPQAELEGTPELPVRPRTTETVAAAAARAPLVLRVVDDCTLEPLPGLSLVLEGTSGECLQSRTTSEGTGRVPDGVLGTYALTVHDGARRLECTPSIEHDGGTAPVVVRARVGPTYELLLANADAPADALVFSLELPGEPASVPSERGRLAARVGGRAWVRFAPLPDLVQTRHGLRSTLVLRARTVDGGSAAAARVHVWPGRHPRPVSLRFTPSSRIRGSVTGDDGPLTDAEVRVSVAGGRVATARTDQAGRWELTGLAPGPAQLSVDAARFERYATQLELRLGAPASVDTILRPLPLGDLTGLLSSESGAHTPRGVLRLVAQDGSGRLFTATAEPSSGGHRFTFEGVPHGAYRLLPPTGDARVWMPACRDVVVPATGVDFVCRDELPAHGLAFRVYDERGEALERFAVQLQLQLERGRIAESAGEAFPPLRRMGRFGDIVWDAVPRDVDFEWLVTVSGYRVDGGRRSRLTADGDRLVAEVHLRPARREHVWVGTRDVAGASRPLGAAEIRGAGGVLTRTLSDGHAILEAAYDPGPMQVHLPGWRVVDESRDQTPQSIWRVWMEPSSAM